MCLLSKNYPEFCSSHRIETLADRRHNLCKKMFWDACWMKTVVFIICFSQLIKRILLLINYKIDLNMTINLTTRTARLMNSFITYDNSQNICENSTNILRYLKLFIHWRIFLFAYLLLTNIQPLGSQQTINVYIHVQIRFCGHMIKNICGVYDVNNLSEAVQNLTRPRQIVYDFF